MAEPLFIGDLISKVTSGQIRIPSFQRGFIWDADRVAHLMDSIYKGYPFGVLLFWRTKTPLSTERNLGPFELPRNDPDYPIDYILDGQQRATSIFGVFQTSLASSPGKDDAWTKIYFDLASQNTLQDSQFLFLPDSEVDTQRHFPLRILFDPPSYRQFLKTMDESIAGQVDNLYEKFTRAKIPIQTFETNDRAAVAIVFERINRLGVELDTLQLLSAWSWSEDFDLQDKFSELAEELAPFGFRNVGEDSDLLLRCCAAIIANDASPATIINLKGSEVRNRFPEIRSGILGAVDFLKTQFHVYSTSVLPYTNILIPLSVFFATIKDQSTHPDAEQHIAITQWVWRTFFTRRYSKRLEQLNEDIQQISLLKTKQTHALGSFYNIGMGSRPYLNRSYFLFNQFSLRAVDSKTFILMLANMRPLDFVGGGEIALGNVLRECNKKEFHHIYPRASLKQMTKINYGNLIDSLANICILPRASNNKIGGVLPSQYRQLMPEEQSVTESILIRALCPNDIFHDDFDRFISERINILCNAARNLMGFPEEPENFTLHPVVMSDDEDDIPF